MRTAFSTGHLLLLVATLIAVFDLASGRDGINPLLLCFLVGGAAMVVADACAREEP